MVFGHSDSIMLVQVKSRLLPTVPYRNFGKTTFVISEIAASCRGQPKTRHPAVTLSQLHS